VPSDITVVIATIARMPLIQTAALFSGRVIRFTDNKLASAFESIQLNHPRLVAIEAPFAQTPQGQAFIERVEKLGVRGSTIQLIVQTNGKWATTPYGAQPEAAAAGGAKADAHRTAAVIAVSAAVTRPPQGANTRRAHRFKFLESLNAVVENRQTNLVNISILGAQVVSQPVLRPNDNVKIALPDANDTLRLTAHVAWSTFEQGPRGAETYYRAGMEFTDAAKEILEDYCRRHCDDLPLPSY
jgi:PilZ domain-containing protein